MKKIMSIVGTRPEAIKLAPVIKELESRPDEIESIVVSTAQHRTMLDQVFGLFDVVPNYDLDVMKHGQTPTQVASIVLAGLERVLQAERPDWVLIQGDTTTVMAASIAAFYQRVKIAHVEAGLRTYDKWQPFPEEVNRRVASVVADVHFAPTETSRENLLRENVLESAILVTGNTVIDALHWVSMLPLSSAAIRELGEAGLGRVLRRNGRDERVVLVTAHRRENFGGPLESICTAIQDLSERYGDRLSFVYPVHPNPRVQETVRRMLGDVPNVVLTPPLSYLGLVHVLKRSAFVLTDSGGLQEEAPGLGVPVLVLRETTERPEGIEAGTVRLAGTRRHDVVREASRLLDDRAAYDEMACAINPYGDGMASGRIVDALLGRASTGSEYKSTTSRNGDHRYTVESGS